MKSLRIALVSFEYPPDSGLGGIATYMAQAAQLLTNRGHDVEVFASSPTRNEMCFEKGICVHWIKERSRIDFPVIVGHRIAERHAIKPFHVLESPEYYADGRKAIELIPELPLVVRMHTPSRLIIEMSWPHASWYPVTRGRELLISFLRICFNKSGNLPNVNPKQLAFSFDKAEKEFTQKANRVVALCRDLQTFALSSWKINPKRLLISPNMYQPSAELLAIKPRAKAETIGYFGRLERRKGIDLLVKAIPEIVKCHPHVRFLFVGKNMEYQKGMSFYEWMQQELKPYWHHIELIDYVPLDRMPDMYAKVDICVFPSRWENFPNVCLEAMSAGKAVIGSRFGGMGEMMPGDQLGLTVNPFNTQEVVAAACRLLQHDEERIAMGEAARKHVQKTYNHDVIGKALEAIYREAIADKQNQKK